MMLVVGGLLVIWVFVAIHTSSTFLATMGIFTMFLAFPASYFVFVIPMGFDIFTVCCVILSSSSLSLADDEHINAFLGDWYWSRYVLCILYIIS